MTFRENSEYESVIGLGIHAQLLTKSKIFVLVALNLAQKAIPKFTRFVRGNRNSVGFNKRAVELAIKGFGIKMFLLLLEAGVPLIEIVSKSDLRFFAL